MESRRPTRVGTVASLARPVRGAEAAGRPTVPETLGGGRIAVPEHVPSCISLFRGATENSGPLLPEVRSGVRSRRAVCPRGQRRRDQLPPPPHL